MGSEVPISDASGSDWSGGATVRDDVLSAVGLYDRGDQCAGRSRAPAGEGAATAIGIGADGGPERTYCDTVVQRISEFAQEAVLGQSFLGEGLLRGHGGAERGDGSEVRPVPGERGARPTAPSIGPSAVRLIEEVSA